MVYDLATGNIILSGGGGSKVLNDTWTWDGTTWTNQAPATSPHARYVASMAYDPATRNVVLFGGFGEGALGDTWTWGSSS
jgi:hypothetical protein